MSWEGYQQVLCKNGHLLTIDADYPTKQWLCPICGEKCVWWNLVDLTNGSFDDQGNSIDGHIDLKIKTPLVMCTCKTCGNAHTIEQATYEIPEGGHLI